MILQVFSGKCQCVIPKEDKFVNYYQFHQTRIYVDAMYGYEMVTFLSKFQEIYEKVDLQNIDTFVPIEDHGFSILNLSPSSDKNGWA